MGTDQRSVDQPPKRLSVVLDTDIGSDVDDAMALAILLGSDEVDLLGVSTVYGDTLLRARLTSRYAALAGRRLSVHAGLTTPASGREVWWAGHEGSLHDQLDDEPVASRDGVAFLIETVTALPGQVHVIAIGPLTNIAEAIRTDPRFVRDAAGLWIMGGAFDPGAPPEHNIRSDDHAARIVFDSGIPIVITGLECTRQVQIAAAELARLAAAGPLGYALARDIEQWWAFWQTEWNVPHDPVTVLSVLRPDLFDLTPPGRVTVHPAVDASDEPGRTSFRPDAGGSVRVVSGLRAPAVAQLIIDRIVAAGLSG